VSKQSVVNFYAQPFALGRRQYDQEYNRMFDQVGSNDFEPKPIRSQILKVVMVTAVAGALFAALFLMTQVIS
jgi:hypothetical protein